MKTGDFDRRITTALQQVRSYLVGPSSSVAVPTQCITQLVNFNFIRAAPVDAGVCGFRGESGGGVELYTKSVGSTGCLSVSSWRDSAGTGPLPRVVEQEPAMIRPSCQTGRTKLALASISRWRIPVVWPFGAGACLGGFHGGWWVVTSDRRFHLGAA